MVSTHRRGEAWRDCEHWAMLKQDRKRIAKTYLDERKSMTTKCPHCSTPLTLTLAAEPAKVERGWVVQSDVGSLYFRAGSWSVNLSDAAVFKYDWEAQKIAVDGKGLNYVLEVHRINGEWRLVDDKPAKERPKFVFERGDVVYRIQGGKSVWLVRGGSTYGFDNDGAWMVQQVGGRRSVYDTVLNKGEIVTHLLQMDKDAVFPDDKPAEAKVPSESIPYWRQVLETDVEGLCNVMRDHDKAIKELEARLAKVEGK